MCTVAFFPYHNQYYFASLRDENPQRKQALPTAIYTIKGIEIVAPLDGLAGGTWVGANHFGNILILLNGAFKRHISTGHYRLSRGIIVKALLLEEAPVHAWQQMDLQRIEPFTLIVWQQQQLFELVWDGEQKYIQQLLISQPHIWSSSTLYHAAAKQQRQAAMTQWWAIQPMVSKQSIWHFFQSVADEQNGFIINRGTGMQTLSYTMLMQNNYATTCDYHDLLSATCTTQQLRLKRLTEAF